MHGISTRSPVRQRALASGVRRTTRREGAMAILRKILAAASVTIALLAIGAAPGTAQTIGGERECSPIYERAAVIFWANGDIWIIYRVIGETCVEVID